MFDASLSCFPGYWHCPARSDVLAVGPNPPLAPDLCFWARLDFSSYAVYHNAAVSRPQVENISDKEASVRITISPHRCLYVAECTLHPDTAESVNICQSYLNIC